MCVCVWWEGDLRQSLVSKRNRFVSVKEEEKIKNLGDFFMFIRKMKARRFGKPIFKRFYLGFSPG